jgi:hypothetical protein
VGVRIRVRCGVRFSIVTSGYLLILLHFIMSSLKTGGYSENLHLVHPL